MSDAAGPGARTPEQIALAQQTLAHIQEHSNEWEQGSWRCGTGMCYAGHALTLAGREWALPEPSTLQPWKNSLIKANPGDPSETHWFDSTLGIDVTTASDAAERLLGLTKTEADVLFAGSNTFDDLRWNVERIAAGKAVRWRD